MILYVEEVLRHAYEHAIAHAGERRTRAGYCGAIEADANIPNSPYQHATLHATRKEHLYSVVRTIITLRNSI